MSITPSKQTSVYRQVDAIMKRKIYTAETSSHEKSTRRKGQHAVKVKRRPRFFTTYCETDGTPYGAKRCALLGALGDMLPQENFF